MARGTRTDPELAAQVLAMSKAGYPGSKIAAKIDIAVHTVGDILNGRNGWDIICQNAEFKSYCDAYDRSLHLSLMEITKKAVMRVDEGIANVSAGQAMWIAGVAFDKVRLLRGEPTTIVESLSREKWDKQTDELVMYYAEVGRRRLEEKVIEVESKSEDVDS